MDENSLANKLRSILNTPIKKTVVDHILIESQIPKGNKVFVVEASVVFMDISKSTKLTKLIGLLNMTKVYKMFSNIAAMAVDEYNGRILQFAGDGFMAAFCRSNYYNHRENAYLAIKRFKYLLDNLYKSLVESNLYFDCGYSIASGHIYMTRLKAKQYNLHSFGIFPGDATNLSSKLCSFAKKNQLIVDQSTFDMIKNREEFTSVFDNELEVTYYKCQLKK